MVESVSGRAILTSTPMANAEPQGNPPPVVREFAPLAGVLSYLVPGLGQIVQGRVGKGLLFLVCLYGLFFTGLALGDWRNVYLPDPTPLPPVSLRIRGIGIDLKEGVPKAVAHRLHFAGQFWIGVAAWPALYQYAHFDPAQESNPVLGTFMRAPRDPSVDPQDERDLNDWLTNRDKSPDLGWVYTVIAGVLNILVIYDAVAGPAFGVAAPSATPAPSEEVAAV
jgi:hypothetical protein